MRLLTAFEGRLDGLSIHRLTLYALLAIVLWAVMLSMFGVLGYMWADIAVAAVLAVAVAVTTNQALARALGATTDPQSSVITGLIVVMLVPVGLSEHWLFLIAAAAFAVASKYMVTVDKQHIFNPAALAVAAIPMLFPEEHANWWIGTTAMLPAIVVLGGLVVLKTRRFGLVATFLAIQLIIAVAAGFLYSPEAADAFGSALEALRSSVVSTALVFFAFAMLTDPNTIPSGRSAKHVYAAFVAVLYSTPDLRFLPWTATPEVAICIGNAASFIARPKYRLLLSLKKKLKIGPDTWAFEFAAPQRMAFAPGQYMEWTVPHSKPDGRGQRRYLTIASSPTEENLKVAMRVPQTCSSYKRALVGASIGAPVVASKLAGDFVLPRDLRAPLAFLAGGVGVAPFRSMAQYIVDKGLRCDVVLLYCCRRSDEFLSTDVFEAATGHGMRTVYVVTGTEVPHAGWKGRTGRIDHDAIREEVPGFHRRKFFLSGSHGMVDGMESVLRDLGVRRRCIEKDYFDGSTDT